MDIAKMVSTENFENLLESRKEPKTGSIAYYNPGDASNQVLESAEINLTST